MALTATATERVREDIVSRLRLKDPATFVASFYRPNLRYRVIPRRQPIEQIVNFLAEREGESGIIYCFSRATAERIAESLSSRGYEALPYHAGLSPKERSSNQEKFIRDEVKVICATIAFGMGINKPNVRWVIHHDLPKNLEGYYQETGRAGRDGLASDCLLLYSAGDFVKQKHFLEEVTDTDERTALEGQLRKMLDYSESAGCRWEQLLSYFGESSDELPCGTCDNCLNPPKLIDATLPAQKFLSCVYRIAELQRFSTGLAHVADILMGNETEKVLRWGHEKLSTFGIGGEHSRNEWLHIGRELVRIGHLKLETGKFPTAQLTPKGTTCLRSRQLISIRKFDSRKKKGKPRRVQRTEEAALTASGEQAFQKLRNLRKSIASERGVPPYVILGDATLREMIEKNPHTLEELAEVSGWGTKKLADFGHDFLTALHDHGREP